VIVVKLQEDEIEEVTSLVACEIGRVKQSQYEAGGSDNLYLHRLVDLRNKLACPETELGIDNEELPEFREYALKKYPDELDEDLVTMIEDLIERQREKWRLIT